MSDVPPTREQARLAGRRAARAGLRRSPARGRGGRSTPGSRSPARVPIDDARRVGVKPIVVSIDRPSRTAHEARAVPEVGDHGAAEHVGADGARRRTRTRGRGSRSGARRRRRAAREREPLRATRAGSRWNAVSKHATCGTPGSARRDGSIAASAAGRCSGANGDDAPRARRARRRRRASGACESGPPCTMRCPTDVGRARQRVELRERRSSAAPTSSGARRSRRRVHARSALARAVDAIQRAP